MCASTGAQAAGDHAALRARPRSGTNPRLFLHEDRRSSGRRTAWTTPFEPALDAQCQGDIRSGRTPRPAKSLAEAGQKITVRTLRKVAGRGRQGGLACTKTNCIGRYLRARHGQSGNRRDLCRSRRRTDRRPTSRSSKKRASRRSTSSMSITSISAPISATPWRWTRTTPRTGADRHLSRHASGRAADARIRRNSVRPTVLRFGPLRSVERRPREDEHAPRLDAPDTMRDAAQGRHPRDPQGTRGICATAAAKSTISIISAIAACVRSAN